MNSGLLSIQKSIKMNANFSTVTLEENNFEELPLESISSLEDFEKSLKLNEEKRNRYVSIILILKKM